MSTFGGASPVASATAGATPAQSPMLPSRITVAAQASPALASTVARTTIASWPGWRRCHHHAQASSRSASGGTSQGESGTGTTGCATASGISATVNAPVASRADPPSSATATKRIVPEAGSKARAIDASTTALPPVPLPSPTAQPPLSYTTGAPSVAPAQDCRSSRVTVAPDVDVVTTVVATSSMPFAVPAAVTIAQPVDASSSTSMNRLKCGVAANAAAAISAAAAATSRAKNRGRDANGTNACMDELQPGPEGQARGYVGIGPMPRNNK